MARLLIGLAYLAGTGVWLLASFLTDALRCDDSCRAPQYATDWGDLVDAWQWRAVLVCGVVGGIAALIVVALSIAHRVRPAVAAVAMQAGAMGYALALTRSSERLSAGPVLWLVVSLIAGAGLALALLSRRRGATIAA